MATELGVAYLSITADTRKLDKSIRGSLDGAEKGSEKSGSRIGGKLAAGVKAFAKVGMVGAGLVAGAALTKGFSRAIQLQDATAKLEGLGHNAANVAGIMDNALAAVKGTAFGMGEAGSVAANMVAAGVKPGQDLERSLRLVGDAATIAGTDMGSMGAIFGKVAASNKVQMDVINQLHDAGVPALSLLADQMGVTAEEASAMASAGKIDFATFQAAMEAGLGGAALKSGETFTGAMKNVGASFGRLGAMFATPVVSGMPVVFQAITGAVDSLGTALKPVADRFSAWLVPALQSTADGIGKIGPAISGVWSLLKTGDFTGSIREALGVEEDSALVGGILKFREVAVGIFSEVSGGVKAMFGAFRDGGSDLTSGGFAGFLETIGLVARALWDSLGPAIKELAPQIMTLLQTFSPLGLAFKVLEPILPQVAEALTAVAGAVGGALAAVLPVVVGLVTMLADVLSGTLVQLLPTVASVIGLLADAFADILPVLMPIVPMLGQALVVAVKTLLPPLLGLVKSVLPILAGVLTTVVAAIAPVIPLIGKALVGAVMAVLPPLLEIAKAVLPILAQVLVTVVEALLPIIPALLEVVKAFLPLLPVIGDLVMALLPPLLTLVTALAPVIQTVAKVLAAILVPVIKVAGAIIQWLVEKVITPLVKWLSENIPIAIAALKIVWDQVWNGIKATISTVWNWINTWVITPFKLALEALKIVFQVVKDAIGTAWNTMKSGLKSGWDWISKNVFDPLKAGVSLIGDAFSNVKDAIGTAWDALKAIAAKPVNFVLGTVYNDGIREWWNKIAGAVGLDSLKLPKASLVKFANGSEDHRAQIARGGAMRLWAEPETGGEAYIPLSPAKRGRSTAILGEVARRFGYGLTAYANGGIRKGETGGFWDNVGGVVSSIGRGVRSFGETLWDAGAMALEVIKDPVGAIKKAVAELMENAGTGGNSSGLFDIVGTLPAKFAGGLAEKVKALLGAQPREGGDVPPAGMGAGALGVARMTQLLKGLVPSARVTSGFRPGAITATGYPSMHGAGRAIDIGAAAPGDAAGMMAIFNALRNSFPNATELIYSPAGARQLYKGKSYVYPEPTRGMHYDHVHWAMANGGIIPGLYDQGGWLPDGGVGVNLTGKPEAVLTPEESAALKNGTLGRALVENLIVRDERTAIDELERMQRRQLTQQRVTGVLR